MSLEDRFHAKYEVDEETGCWNWTAYIDECGYGRLKEDGRKGRWRGAHRIAYEIHKGEIPKGLEIDHLCRNRKCVNPDHLETVTHRENVIRGAKHGTYGSANRRKTHCPQGHPYDEENTYIKPNGDRKCRICNRNQARIASKKYYWRKKSARLNKEET